MSPTTFSERQRIFRSFALRGGSLVLLGTCIAAAAWAQMPGDQNASENKDLGSTAVEVAAQNDRLREGSVLSDELGHFRLAGDRMTFVLDRGERRLGGLENLALERVAKIIGDSPEQLQWSVSGTVTEYQGTNYLLVTRAVLKSRPSHRTGTTK